VPTARICANTSLSLERMPVGSASSPNRAEPIPDRYASSPLRRRKGDDPRRGRQWYSWWPGTCTCAKIEPGSPLATSEGGSGTSRRVQIPQRSEPRRLRAIEDPRAKRGKLPTASVGSSDRDCDVCVTAAFAVSDVPPDYLFALSLGHFACLSFRFRIWNTADRVTPAASAITWKLWPACLAFASACL
jgi:hypothetical protein